MGLTTPNAKEFFNAYYRDRCLSHNILSGK